MLRQQSAESVLTLARKMNEQKVYLQALPGTPLAEAVAACYTPTLDNPSSIKNSDGSVDVYSVAYRLREGSVLKGADGQVQHDIVMQRLTNVIGQSVQGNLILARNVVNPIVDAVTKDVDAAVHDARIATINALSVEPNIWKKLWNSPLLTGLVERYVESSPRNVKLVDVHNELSHDELTDLLHTGQGRLDTEIDQWISEVGMEFVSKTYKDVFAKATPGQLSAGGQLNNYIGTTVGDRERTLAIHLMARKLALKVQDGIEMNLNDYREQMAYITEQTGRVLNRIFEIRERNNKQGMLIEQWPIVEPDFATAETGVIVVNADIYSNWLNDGGAPEVLFGAYLSNRKVEYKQLLTMADELKKVWERQAALLRSTAMSNRYNHTVAAIRQAVTKQINTIPDEELVVKSRAALHQRLTDAIGQITYKQAEDVYGTCRKLVCDVMFAHTDAFAILEKIDDVVRANPGKDLREAALLATIDIVVAWVCKSFIVTK
jgi:hypothetical protein